MAVLSGKATDLVLDTWAVTRADALNDSGKHRASVEAAPDDVVSACVRVGHPAHHLARMIGCRAHEAEHRHRIHITRLLRQFAEVDRASVDSRWRTRL